MLVFSREMFSRPRKRRHLALLPRISPNFRERRGGDHKLRHTHAARRDLVLIEHNHQRAFRVEIKILIWREGLKAFLLCLDAAGNEIIRLACLHLLAHLAQNFLANRLHIIAVWQE